MTTAAISLLLILALKAASPKSITFLEGFLRREETAALPLGILAVILFWFAYVNCYLAVFNLIPVPPLDGSGVLSGFLSYEAAAAYERIRPYGFIIVMGLIVLGVLDLIMGPILKFIVTVIFS